MSVKCGNHTTPTHHDTVADVRACYQGNQQVKDHYQQFPYADRNPRQAEVVTVGSPNRSATMDQLKRAHELNPRFQAAEVEVDPRHRPATDKQISYLKSLLVTRFIPEHDRAWADEIGNKLVDDGLWGNDGDGDSGAAYDRPAAITLKEASMAIEILALLPKAQRTLKDVAAEYPHNVKVLNGYATEDGIYRNPSTGEIFKGQFNRAQGDGRHLYFKRLLVDGQANVPLTEGDLLRQGGKARDWSGNGSWTKPEFDWQYAGSASKVGVLASWKVTREQATAFGSLYGVCVRCHRDLTNEESIDRAMGPVCAGKMGW